MMSASVEIGPVLPDPSPSSSAVDPIAKNIANPEQDRQRRISYQNALEKMLIDQNLDIFEKNDTIFSSGLLPNFDESKKLLKVLHIFSSSSLERIHKKIIKFNAKNATYRKNQFEFFRTRLLVMAIDEFTFTTAECDVLVKRLIHVDKSMSYNDGNFEKLQDEKCSILKQLVHTVSDRLQIGEYQNKDGTEFKNIQTDIDSSCSKSSDHTLSSGSPPQIRVPPKHTDPKPLSVSAASSVHAHNSAVNVGPDDPRIQIPKKGADPKPLYSSPSSAATASDPAIDVPGGAIGDRPRDDPRIQIPKKGADPKPLYSSSSSAATVSDPAIDVPGGAIGDRPRASSPAVEIGPDDPRIQIPKKGADPKPLYSSSSSAPTVSDPAIDVPGGAIGDRLRASSPVVEIGPDDPRIQIPKKGADPKPLYSSSSSAATVSDPAIDVPGGAIGDRLRASSPAVEIGPDDPRIQIPKKGVDPRSLSPSSSRPISSLPSSDPTIEVPPSHPIYNPAVDVGSVTPRIQIPNKSAKPKPLFPDTSTPVHVGPDTSTPVHVGPDTSDPPNPESIAPASTSASTSAAPYSELSVSIAAGTSNDPSVPGAPASTSASTSAAPYSEPSVSIAAASTSTASAPFTIPTSITSYSDPSVSTPVSTLSSSPSVAPASKPASKAAESPSSIIHSKIGDWDKNIQEMRDAKILELPFQATSSIGGVINDKRHSKTVPTHLVPLKPDDICNDWGTSSLNKLKKLHLIYTSETDRKISDERLRILYRYSLHAALVVSTCDDAHIGLVRILEHLFDIYLLTLYDTGVTRLTPSQSIPNDVREMINFHVRFLAHNILFNVKSFSSGHFYGVLLPKVFITLVKKYTGYTIYKDTNGNYLYDVPNNVPDNPTLKIIMAPEYLLRSFGIYFFQQFLNNGMSLAVSQSTGNGGDRLDTQSDIKNIMNTVKGIGQSGGSPDLSRAKYFTGGANDAPPISIGDVEDPEEEDPHSAAVEVGTDPISEAKEQQPHVIENNPDAPESGEKKSPSSPDDINIPDIDKGKDKVMQRFEKAVRLLTSGREKLRRHTRKWRGRVLELNFKSKGVDDDEVTSRFEKLMETGKRMMGFLEAKVANEYYDLYVSYLDEWNKSIEDSKEDQRRELDRVISAVNEHKRKENEKKQRIRAGDKPVRLGGASELLFGFFKIDLVLLYMFKLLRTGIQIVCIYVAQKVFQEKYVRYVHVQQRDPPPLTNMLIMFMSFDATVQVVLLMLILAASFIYKRPGNTFVIDEDFISMLVSEYIATWVVTMIIGYVLASTLRQKRYFEYKKHGIATSKAYRDMLASIAVITTFIPFNAIFNGIFT